MRTVELWPAYFWTCEECGRDNFVRSVLVEESPRAKGTILIAGEPIEAEFVNFGWRTAPGRVTCENCGVKFKAEETL